MERWSSGIYSLGCVFSEAAAVGMSWGSSVIIGHYHTNNHIMEKNETEQRKPCLHTLAQLKLEQFVIKHLPPSWTTGLSPSTFAITWALFALTATTIYHLHRNDTYQDYVLAVIVAGCVIWSLMIGEQTVIEILGVSLPRFIALGLFLSIVVHMMGGWKKMNRQQDGQEEILVVEKEKYAGQP